jgi:hypothetical protein
MDLSKTALLAKALSQPEHAPASFRQVGGLPACVLGLARDEIGFIGRLTEGQISPLTELCLLSDFLPHVVPVGRSAIVTTCVVSAMKGSRAGPYMAAQPPLHHHWSDLVAPRQGPGGLDEMSALTMPSTRLALASSSAPVGGAKRRRGRARKETLMERIMRQSLRKVLVTPRGRHSKKVCAVGCCSPTSHGCGSE